MLARETARARFCRRRAVTLSETLVLVAVAGLLILVIGLGMDGLRTELKREQALGLMRGLNRALLAYRQSTGAWPVDPGAAPDAGAAPSDRSPTEPEPGTGRRVLELMSAVPASRTILNALPPSLHVPRPAHPQSSRLPLDLRDPWGRPLQCLTAASPSPSHRKAVAANRNRPIFVSAGPDGRFGSGDAPTASDNIRSDENAE